VPRCAETVFLFAVEATRNVVLCCGVIRIEYSILPVSAILLYVNFEKGAAEDHNIELQWRVILQQFSRLE
jgi:hypothetical protein